MVPPAVASAKASLLLPFVHLTAFSTHIADGNPAAVVFLSREHDTLLSDVARQTIGANFHQPMTAFVVPREAGREVLPVDALAFNIEYSYD